LVIPIPPLKEQVRIVAELERLFAIIDSIENSKCNLQESIRVAKSKILDLAIHGKLVLQDPNDEPASELLKRIAPHATPCDTSHYENLPASWCVCKVETIADVISGVSYDKSDVQRSGIKILRGGNIQDGKIVEQDDDVYISEK
jgi:type I restriction enzyme S subunit